MTVEPSPGVLVVDDRPELRAWLQTVLRNAGFDAWLAPGGAPAADLYARHHDRIAVVLLTAADSDPIPTLRSLQAVNPQVICCVLAGTNEPALAGDLIAAGAVRVIHTPFDPAALGRLLWDVIGPADRRARPRGRRRAKQVAVAAGLDPKQEVMGRVADESPSGLRLIAAEPLGDVGSILSVRPADAADGPWVPVQVRHSRPDGQEWSVGCQFVHAETAADDEPDA
jgi:CheY-like chemotaxis protein